MVYQMHGDTSFFISANLYGFAFPFIVSLTDIIPFPWVRKAGLTGLRFLLHNYSQVDFQIWILYILCQTSCAHLLNDFGFKGRHVLVKGAAGIPFRFDLKEVESGEIR